MCYVCLLCFLCLDFCLWCLPGWWDNDYTFCCVGFCVLGVVVVLCSMSAVLYRQWLRSALCPLFCIDDGYVVRYVLFCALGVACFV